MRKVFKQIILFLSSIIKNKDNNLGTLSPKINKNNFINFNYYVTSKMCYSYFASGIFYCLKLSKKHFHCRSPPLIQD